MGNIVIIGTGQAGVSVAFKLRALGYQEDITLIGEEADLPYHRPPLSKKYITNIADAERLHLKPKELYERDRISLMLGCRVMAVHREKKSIFLADGRTFDYDFLVFATGADARRLEARLGGHASNIYTLRTLADATRLKGAFAPDRKLLVVGGGYIGLETAAVARSLGMHVTLIEQGSRILGRVAAAETASYFRALHQDNGVTVREGLGLDRIEHSNGRAVTARLTDGTALDVDVVVAGIGVVPATSLAAQAALEIGNGIVTDCAGRTSDPSIYAVGDCACFPYQDNLIRLESVQNAIDMAEVAARSMLGEAVQYQPVPWFWSDQYATKLQISGLNLGYTHVVVRKETASRISVWYYKEERFIAVDAINDAKAFMTAKRWLSVGSSPVCDEIADASIALSDVSLSHQACSIT